MKLTAEQSKDAADSFTDAASTTISVRAVGRLVRYLADLGPTFQFRSPTIVDCHHPDGEEKATNLRYANENKEKEYKKSVQSSKLDDAKQKYACKSLNDDEFLSRNCTENKNEDESITMEELEEKFALPSNDDSISNEDSDLDLQGYCKLE